MLCIFFPWYSLVNMWCTVLVKPWRNWEEYGDITFQKGIQGHYLQGSLYKTFPRSVLRLIITWKVHWIRTNRPQDSKVPDSLRPLLHSLRPLLHVSKKIWIKDHFLHFNFIRLSLLFIVCNFIFVSAAQLRIICRALSWWIWQALLCNALVFGFLFSWIPLKGVQGKLTRIKHQAYGVDAKNKSSKVAHAIDYCPV